MHSEIATVAPGRGNPPGSTSLVRFGDTLTLPGFTMKFAADAEIFGEDEAADFVYKVITGAVRTTRLFADGRRQVAAFYLPGDVFGLENGETRRLSAEAVTDTRVALVSRSALTKAAERDSRAAHLLWSMASRELEQLQEHMLLLGRKNAAERVGTFLLHLAARESSETVELAMSRSDIADHLGLTIETVSRTLNRLARNHAIALPSARRVVLRDREALGHA